MSDFDERAKIMEAVSRIIADGLPGRPDGPGVSFQYKDLCLSSSFNSGYKQDLSPLSLMASIMLSENNILRTDAIILGKKIAEQIFERKNYFFKPNTVWAELVLGNFGTLWKLPVLVDVYDPQEFQWIPESSVFFIRSASGVQHTDNFHRSVRMDFTIPSKQEPEDA